jgi:hypothetical protein
MGCTGTLIPETYRRCVANNRKCSSTWWGLLKVTILTRSRAADWHRFAATDRSGFGDNPQAFTIQLIARAREQNDILGIGSNRAVSTRHCMGCHGRICPVPKASINSDTLIDTHHRLAIEDWKMSCVEAGEQSATAGATPRENVGA